ncbi:hypothetical protein [Rhizobium sp. BE258]|uniref:hypothetical protein n=1 Tax=Rhizobium sp. BE258 TaxID=2817722 RepID=UPI00285DE7A8|nr:hypothetical protein [Rhizobium sp. BE258]MDR7148031.1 hypothetical protein [Rhizobium sp. BE258]
MEYKPKYRWKETWPGEGQEDYEAFDVDKSFGRIQIDKTSDTKIGQWKWNITHIDWARQHILPHGGWAPDAREASRMVEEHYEKLKKLHGR